MEILFSSQFYTLFWCIEARSKCVCAQIIHHGPKVHAKSGQTDTAEAGPSSKPPCLLSCQPSHLIDDHRNFGQHLLFIFKNANTLCLDLFLYQKLIRRLESKEAWWPNEWWDQRMCLIAKMQKSSDWDYGLCKGGVTKARIALTSGVENHLLVRLPVESVVYVWAKTFVWPAEARYRVYGVTDNMRQFPFEHNRRHRSVKITMTSPWLCRNRTLAS